MLKKTFIIFMYWWCIMYPSIALKPSHIATIIQNNTDNYELRLGIVETIKKFSCK